MRFGREIRTDLDQTGHGLLPNISAWIEILRAIDDGTETTSRRPARPEGFAS